jgi:hypothetical protein
MDGQVPQLRGLDPSSLTGFVPIRARLTSGGMSVYAHSELLTNLAGLGVDHDVPGIARTCVPILVERAARAELGTP